MSETCWVCLRITPEYVLKSAHKLWTDAQVARKIAKISSEIIEAKYSVNRFFFCGRPARTIVGGLFYIMGVIGHEYVKTQTQVSIALNTHHSSIRFNYKRWLNAFPDLEDTIKAKMLSL